MQTIRTGDMNLDPKLPIARRSCRRASREGSSQLLESRVQGEAAAKPETQPTEGTARQSDAIRERRVVICRDRLIPLPKRRAQPAAAQRLQ